MDLMIAEADALINEGKYEEALKVYNEILKNYPNNAVAYCNKGIALYYLGRYEEALIRYDKAIELNPNYAHAYNNKGLALYNLGKNSEALDSWNTALELNPNNAIAYNNKGNELYNLGNYEEALWNYEKALELNPNKERTYYSKALILKNLGRFEEALINYERLLELNPNDTEAYNEKGVVLENLERKEEALKSYDKALKLNPNYLNAQNNKKNVQNIYSNLKQIRNNEITKHDLSNLNLGDSGARSLAEALRQNHTITSLNLEGNNIGEDGIKALIDALKENKCLSYLYGINDNQLNGLVNKNKQHNHILAEIIKQEFGDYLHAALENKQTECVNFLKLEEITERKSAINYLLQNDDLVEASKEEILFFNVVMSELERNENVFISVSALFDSSIKKLALYIFEGHYNHPENYPSLDIYKKEGKSYKLTEKFTQKILQVPPIPCYEAAIKAQLQEDYISAFLNIEKVQAVFPTHCGIILEKAKILYLMREYAEADECLEQAINVSEINIEKFNEIKQCFEYWGELNQVIKLQNKILSVSKSLEKYDKLAKLYFKNNQWIKALGCYNTITQLYPYNLSGYIEKAKLVYNKGYYAKFDTIIEEAKSKIDLATKNYEELANWLEERGDKVKAARYYEEILENETSFEKYNHIANLYKKEENYQKASEILERLVDKLKNDGDNINLKITYFELASMYEKQGRLQDKLKADDQILEIERNNFEGHFGKGRTLVDLQKYEDAKEEFDVSSIINRRASGPYIEKAKMYETRDDREEALATLKQAYQFTDSEGRDKISSEIAKINSPDEKDHVVGDNSEDRTCDSNKEVDFNKRGKEKNKSEYAMQYSITGEREHSSEEHPSETSGTAASSAVGWNEVDNSTLDPNQHEYSREISGEDIDYFNDNIG